MGNIFDPLRSVSQLGQINVEATRLVGSLQPMARFGSVVMSPGDLDMDGFKGGWCGCTQQRLSEIFPLQNANK